MALDVAVGEYENFSGPTQDYTYYSLTLEKDGFYGKYAGSDFEVKSREVKILRESEVLAKVVN